MKRLTFLLLLVAGAATALGADVLVEAESFFEVVVVGGGIAGCSAALTAARLGLHVAFIQNRPVLGGNASPEIGITPRGQDSAIVAEMAGRDRASVQQVRHHAARAGPTSHAGIAGGFGKVCVAAVTKNGQLSTYPPPARKPLQPYGRGGDRTNGVWSRQQ